MSCRKRTAEANKKTSESLKKYWADKKKPRKYKNGYMVVFVNGERQYEHRMMIEKALGRKLLTGEHVHHINGDKTDNRIENLELISSSEHMRRHALKNGLGKDRVGKPPKNKTNKKTIEKIKALRTAGWLLQDICEEVGLSYPTVQKYANECK